MIHIHRRGQCVLLALSVYRIPWSFHPSCNTRLLPWRFRNVVPRGRLDPEVCAWTGEPLPSLQTPCKFGSGVVQSQDILPDQQRCFVTLNCWFHLLNQSTRWCRWCSWLHRRIWHNGTNVTLSIRIIMNTMCGCISVDAICMSSAQSGWFI